MDVLTLFAVEAGRALFQIYRDKVARTAQRELAFDQAQLAFHQQSELAGATGRAALLQQAIDLGAKAATDLVQSRRQEKIARQAREWEVARQEAEWRHQEKLLEQERRYRLEEADGAAVRELKVGWIKKRLDKYPFERGPGHLRASFTTTHPDPGTRPLLIVLAPPAVQGESGSPWAASLIRRVKMVLAEHVDPPFSPEVYPADSAITWPDSDLYAGDLAGIPTLVVSFELDRERIDVTIGGCHLIPRAVTPMVRSQHVQTVRFSRDDAPEGPEAAAELNHERAARLIAISLVMAVDCFHLLHTPAYEEQLDRVIAAVGPAADRPAQVDLPLGSLRDPAYHLLQRAPRRWLAAPGEQGDADLLLAISLLAGHDRARDDLPPAELLDAAVHGPLAARHHLKRLDEVLRRAPAGSPFAGLELPRRITPHGEQAPRGRLPYRPGESPFTS
ncbi:hypothetical protein [Nonomuraea typhae]|uniref:hypothetical protein n=1 Tax=Nonomuraea typhae TaxID=2603600 RepID=UPI0012F8F258|nr:hypothetical protein [Nonomuraea typhae]